jgi:hypothetical protein
MPDSMGVHRTKAALEQTQGKTVKAVSYEPDGIVFRFEDESILEILIGRERELPDPILGAIFRAKRKGSAA